MDASYSTDCKDVLRKLSQSKNVIISGPPGTGKTVLLAEVAAAFLDPPKPDKKPVHDPDGRVPIPADFGPEGHRSTEDFPGGDKEDRKVFRTVFHQNAKYREFISGIVPRITKEEGGGEFQVIAGTLYRASEHARAEDGASLLIIDEINRGPAIELFGGAIVSIERDKRLTPEGGLHGLTQTFEMLCPDSGKLIEYALPEDLYILAAMNNADTSVEPLDVAFLRRWEIHELLPDSKALRAAYRLPPDIASLPATPKSDSDLFEASFQAWAAVNKRIRIGRGRDYEIGHGVLLGAGEIHELNADEVRGYLCNSWKKIVSHVREVFFGDDRGVAEVFNASLDNADHQIRLETIEFAGELRTTLVGLESFEKDRIYSTLLEIIGDKG